VFVTLTFDKGWHAFANPAGVEDLQGGRTRLSLTSGGEPVGAAVVYAPGRPVEDPVVGTYRIYDGTVVLWATIDRTLPPGKPLEVNVRCLTRSDVVCGPPVVLQLPLR
jgi:hypothetical protein